MATVGGRIWVVLALCAALIAARPARADDVPAPGPPPEAKKAFLDGKAAFERGEYELALQLFQRAALIAPAPSLYFNIGVAYERLARYEDSAIAFERYLELIEAPTTDDDRTFQTNLRARAAANRARARQPGPAGPQAPPPRAAEPALPPPTAYSRYPQYVYAPYTPPPAAYVTPPVAPLSHRQKLEAARRHRNNGIAMLVVGAALLGVGSGLTAWVVVSQPIDRSTDFGPAAYGLTLWGTTIPLIVGVTFAIPGVVALARWQHELNAELRRPDDGAAAGRAALDLAAPPPSLRGFGDRALVLAAPAISF